ncbi:MAG: hypothetical protein NC231_14360 [Bacillus sp. (in: Bacteria)]|nr:hypothetical protein [Bacillus sp. (in: firmicutes)]MCM1427988.1 hypothetical protein [Eubacterium sp.]
MKNIRETLHAKRLVAERHIKQLEREEKAGVRYTAMMPDIPFLILGIICDVGWLMQLIAGIIYLCGNGFCYLLDWLALAALTLVMLGVARVIYLDIIHEKEIATKRQKDFGCGLTVFAGLAGGMIGICQMFSYGMAQTALLCMSIGGFINFAAGLPIYLSFKKGIVYGVQ